MRRSPWITVLLLASLPLTAHAADPPEAGRLRLGFTTTMFVGVNENDARASVRALAATIAQDSGIIADPTPQLFAGAESIDQAVAAATVDAVGLTTIEFYASHARERFDRYLFAIQQNLPSEEYLLLVHRDSPIAQLSDLRGKRLALVEGPRLCFAQPWLEVTLARAHLPDAATLFNRIDRLTKPSKAILDTYFRKLDACLTTRRAFALVAELNPQIGAQLRELAASPPLIPSLFAIRASFDSATKEKMIRVFTSIDRTTSGRQALTIFQVDRNTELPFSALDPTFAFLADFTRLCPQQAAATLARARFGPADAPAAPPP